MYELIGPHSSIVFSRADLDTLLLLLVWSTVWKGIALWKAGRNRQLAWFVILLIVNSLGILEILYIFIFQSEPPKN